MARLHIKVISPSRAGVYRVHGMDGLQLTRPDVLRILKAMDARRGKRQ